VAPEANSPLPHGELIAAPSTLITASRQPWHDGLTANHWRILFASFLGWIFNGYEGYALFLVLPFALQDILTPVQARSTGAVWAGIAISATLLGWGIGGRMRWTGRLRSVEQTGCWRARNYREHIEGTPWPGDARR
jgi:hypothetical protein